MLSFLKIRLSLCILCTYCSGPQLSLQHNHCAYHFLNATRATSRCAVLKAVVDLRKVVEVEDQQAWQRVWTGQRDCLCLTYVLLGESVSEECLDDSDLIAAWSDVFCVYLQNQHSSTKPLLIGLRVGGFLSDSVMCSLSRKNRPLDQEPLATSIGSQSRNTSHYRWFPDRISLLSRLSANWNRHTTIFLQNIFCSEQYWCGSS